MSSSGIRPDLTTRPYIPADPGARGPAKVYMECSARITPLRSMVPDRQVASDYRSENERSGCPIMMIL
jgi:hypothetical protein